MISDLKKLSQKEIVYLTINNSLYRNKDGQIKKKPAMTHNYKNIICKKIHNQNNNSCIIPLGPDYNLIGIDVDNKEDTLERYGIILNNSNENVENTLTLSTVNGGYHFYYRLTINQKNKLNKLNFMSKNDALFGLHIDVKYKNQIFFGPSVFKFENKQYQYKIINDSDPILLPNLLFNELINNIEPKETEKVTKKEIIKEAPKEIIKPIETKKVTKQKEEKTITVFEQYLECLNVSRFTKYDEWLKIGAIIYNEGYDFEIFDKYSSKAKNYDKDSCLEKWNRYKKHKGTKCKIGTLIKWAKQDNFEMFKKVKARSIYDNVFFMLTKSWNDNSISNLYYLMNEDNVIYSEHTKKWYILNKYNIWKEESDLGMLEHISSTIPKVITNEFFNISKNHNDNNLLQELAILNKNYATLFKYICSTNPQKILVEKLKSIYKNKKFHLKMNNINDYLFAFKNGVYDLQNMKFRLPEPHELITRTCDYKYNDKCNDKKLERLNKIINDIFIKEGKEDNKGKDLRNYVMLTIAQCLCGVCVDESFFVWLGQGRNGKGVLRDLIAATFNIYFETMEIDHLDKTKTSSPGAANINLATKQFSRIVMTTEPDSAMQLKTNKLAQWSGRDPVECRFNYDKTTFSYVPKWKLFIQSNYELSFPGKNIKAFTERTNLVRFPFSFVKNKVAKHEKEGDQFLKEELKDEDYKLVFFHYLLKYYKKFLKAGRKINIPASVKEQSDMLFLSTDMVSLFINDRLTKVADTKINIGSAKLYSAFKDYCNNKDVEIKLNVQEFKACMIEKGFKAGINAGRIVWRGVEFKEEITDAKFNEDVDF